MRLHCLIYRPKLAPWPRLQHCFNRPRDRYTILLSFSLIFISFHNLYYCFQLLTLFDRNPTTQQPLFCRNIKYHNDLLTRYVPGRLRLLLWCTDNINHLLLQ